MKKIMLCAAAVAMLGLSACSNKENNQTDSAAVVEENVEVVEAVDTANGDTAVAVEENVEVAPAADSAAAPAQN